MLVKQAVSQLRNLLHKSVKIKNAPECISNTVSLNKNNLGNKLLPNCAGAPGTFTRCL
ncbi:hypothetical protein THF1D04_270045 [Vibrio owensii]|uniref:Uncharacterized protein n=1 Tax=Vibrio owensii TaxID=696485 RepID=A0AAU9Q6I0_9VIBR|nr:hypothetical protein THF1D04_270045 [Vibrio owensii]